MRWVSGVPRSLGTLGGPASEATGVNASGWVVGWSLTAAGEQHAFLWKNGAMTDLGTLGGPLSVATAINAAGTVVGYSTKASGALARKYPFRWRDGVMRELPSLPGTGTDNYAMPWAIQGGVVVGVGAPDGADGDVSHALVWSGGTLTDLGRLGGDYTRASDVNGAGVVVGSIDYNPPDCVGMDAFVVQEGEVTLLPHLGGRNEFSGAMAINRAGWVVGFSETPLGSGDCEAGEVHATLWRPN